jgi:cytochrome P450
MLSIARAIAQLELGLEAIAALTDMIPHEQAIWKPTASDWSILEVINHLYDEEREDFRKRLRQAIEQPQAVLSPIDPEGWVTERRYNERQLQESLAAFIAERRASIAWLGTLDYDEWDRHLNHPMLHELHVGDLLASWAVHDLLHIRQLNELHWHYLATQVAPYRVEYAGDW